MAIVIKRGKMLHIQWWDPLKKKINSKSTGLTSNYENMKLAKQYAKDVQKQITEEYNKIKTNPLRELTVQNTFNHFLDVNKDRAKKTIKDYKNFYSYFTKTFALEDGANGGTRYFSPDDPISVINKISYESWLLSIKKLNLSQNSIHAIGKQGNHFLRHLFEYNSIDYFVVNRDVKTKPHVPRKIVFTDIELITIYENLSDKNENFNMLINLLYYTGLRSKDILTIQIENIDLKQRVFTYLDNKRKIERTVPYHNKLHSQFTQLVKLNKEGRILNYKTEDNITKAVKRYFTRIGLDTRPLSPRIFRKTFMTRLRKLGIDVTLVQELVGHKHTSVIDVHYNAFDKESLKKAINKYPSFEQLKKWEKQKNNVDR